MWLHGYSIQQTCRHACKPAPSGVCTHSLCAKPTQHPDAAAILTPQAWRHAVIVGGRSRLPNSSLEGPKFDTP
jgi:hypothetical protein